MFVVLAFLGLGFIGYMVWRRNTSDLRRECRWRQSREAGVWVCTFCGASEPGTERPNICRRLK
ncbi:hypothetical protein ACFORG_04615 [Lutimaribacter marinistellae]|uniref:Uncharacterized protein n=1 Tax=Lutimaribacter marinistellae TaxID=1820329 RepID=A0ABV7TBY3_9RHOB